MIVNSLELIDYAGGVKSTGFLDRYVYGIRVCVTLGVLWASAFDYC